MNDLVDWRRRSEDSQWLTMLLVVLAPVLVVSTFLAMRPIEGVASALRWVLTADLIYVLVVATLVLRRIAKMIAARRAQSAGSRLHLRLTAVFASVALVPAVLVAIFAMLTVSAALEGWFSTRISGAVDASATAAQAYQAEQRDGLIKDAELLAAALNFERRRELLTDADLRSRLAELESQLQRDLKEIFIVNNLGALRVRGPRSYQFNFEQPTIEQIDAVQDGSVLVIEDFPNQELRALHRLDAFSNHYLYVGRTVDGSLLSLLDQTQSTASFYSQLEQDRGRLLLDFALLYLAFAVILILGATWGGLWFAERLSVPVGRMAAAAQRVGAGDLDARVHDIRGDDEIALLGRYFNQMTHQLKGQRDTLVSSAEQAERRRRLFDSVLSSVTSGVIGVDRDGIVTFINRSARRVLEIPKSREGDGLQTVVPEFVNLFESLRTSVSDVAEDDIKLVRSGKQENLLVRIATWENEEGQREGFVIAFEDVTALVSAQRMAAWGDVARRIAHEVKNPLTPIKLSAERIKRKFSPRLGEDSDQLENMTDVIVRQTDDLRRIVDDFSKFARMPEAQRQVLDVREIVQDAVTLQESALTQATLTLDMPDGAVLGFVDATLLSQALNNLIKNAGEAVDSRIAHQPEPPGAIAVALVLRNKRLEITIQDNGIGLPPERSRLFEPYVTHRDGGTGLGLSIVLKIIEEHGGSLTLEDADWGETDMSGARARILLPMAKEGAAPEQGKQV